MWKKECVFSRAAIAVLMDEALKNSRICDFLSLTFPPPFHPDTRNRKVVVDVNDVSVAVEDETQGWEEEDGSRASKKEAVFAAGAAKNQDMIYVEEAEGRGERKEGKEERDRRRGPKACTVLTLS
ncbi:unnamed protein product [Hydatigera taeniaeformis]|uniref:Uncharacterized protein n=1 Tax=Hydatigena taeniaeformis TaxID=6205 RepID=A0A0R3XA04_HYDTA|nr:unnamed protein product [Hydatigera taeniaeformis]